MSEILLEKFSIVVGEAEQALAEITEARAVENLETEFLGRKGKLSVLMVGMKDVAAADRQRVGIAANEAKQKLTEIFNARRAELAAAALEKIAETEWLDVSEPGRSRERGTLHLTTQAINEISTLFERIGFTRARYPEVDWDWYVFEALNMPPTHPARDDWETFFIDAPHDKQKGKMVLTPHTSNGQIHEMLAHKPPIRLVNIAKCYRRQSDLTHAPMFHQVEALVVDEGISVADLKGTVEYFTHHWFGRDRHIRLRPHHFRFTEPSFEIDVSCGLCHGSGRAAGGGGLVIKCRFCKDGWVELGGAGMVHPNVFKACGVDAKKYTGFAFGWGVERVLMMRSGLNLPDLRELYKNDLRFLRQF